MKPENRDTLGGVMSAISLLVLSAYVVLWADSNKDLLVAGIALTVFIAGIAVAHHRVGVICGAFFFTSLRWIIGAVATGERQAIVAAIVTAALPTAMLLVDAGRDPVTAKRENLDSVHSGKYD